MVSIRLASLHDCSGIAAIAIEVGLSTHLRHGVSKAFAEYVLTEYSADAIRERLQAASNIFWVSQNRDGIDGFLQLILGSQRAFEGSSAYEISTLYVQPRHHGKGKGSGLLRACFRHVLQVGGDGVWLMANATDDRALAFYHRHGFADVGQTSFTLGKRSYGNRTLTISLPHSACVLLEP